MEKKCLAPTDSPPSVPPPPPRAPATCCGSAVLRHAEDTGGKGGGTRDQILIPLLSLTCAYGICRATFYRCRAAPAVQLSSSEGRVEKAAAAGQTPSSEGKQRAHSQYVVEWSLLLPQIPTGQLKQKHRQTLEGVIFSPPQTDTWGQLHSKPCKGKRK
ncbi:hypothetical protein UY3_09838 [Chelonia mydas]|uniref:Uncharacterized protein n=1 Tax=Chelonia mydas TaxID=8469 RepID=M7BBS7_CHEMY|nr:hypothetical protein UY3_09838 [Chelonia mydas]